MVKIREMKDSFRQAGLHTVCESALCPNLGKCWGRGVATFMILGEICTRACRFCGVKTGRPMAVDPQEPRQVASAVQRLNLRYVVVTSVARDDLADEGASQFVRTIHAIRSVMPQTRIEVLIPDFSNKPESLEQLVTARPEVISHNMETVRRLSPDVRPQADYERSLAVLGNLKKFAPSAFYQIRIYGRVGRDRRGDHRIDARSGRGRLRYAHHRPVSGPWAQEALSARPAVCPAGRI